RVPVTRLAAHLSLALPRILLAPPRAANPERRHPSSPIPSGPLSRGFGLPRAGLDMLARSSWVPSLRRQVLHEPSRRQLRHNVQRARLLEEVRRTGNNFEPFGARELRVSLFVERDHRFIGAADNQ